MAVKKNTFSALVYSTHPIAKDDEPDEEVVPPAEQLLQVKLDAKHRAGKVVTIIHGFSGPGLEELGKQLKTHCGTGGSVKDLQVIIQGDHRDKILQWLSKKCYKINKK